MRDDPERRRYDDPNDPYSDGTQDTRPLGRIEPERVEEHVYEERYTGPGRERRYEPVVEERYVERRTSDRDTVSRFAQLIYFIFGVIEALIAIRFVLRLLGANRRAGFADLIYSITGPLVAPFQGLFNEPGFNRSVLEWSSLVAIIVYALLAYALVRLLYLLRG